jgi:hypothetical protein
VSLQSRLTALVTAIGTDIKGIQTQLDNSGVTLDPVHIVGAAGQPAFLTTWTNYGSGFQVAGFRKDPFGRVSVFGSVKSGVTATAVFILPVGYRPTKVWRFNPRGSGQGNTPWAQVNITTDGLVTVYGDAVNNLVTLDGCEFDTESVTEFPLGPQGPKGDPGDMSIYTTLDWDTALTPGFYRSTNDGMLDTVNGPGDTLNPPAQAGVVSVHENGALIQRVWDLEMNRGYTRFKAGFGGDWSAWIPDILKPYVSTESGVGVSPQDGDERYFQTPAMKTLGIMWKFRYNADASGAYKWEFVGGRPVLTTVASSLAYTTGAGAFTWGSAMTTPKYTFPLSGDYDVGFRLNCQSGVSADMRGNVFVDGSAVDGAESMDSLSATKINAHFAGETTKIAVVEGQVADLRMRASTASISTTVWGRGLWVAPRRVSGL